MTGRVPLDDATGATGSWPNAATLVLQADTPEQRVWAARTAVGLVRKQAARRTKVILIDLYPSDSPLEEAIGVGGGRGIVDVLVRERSFSDVARRPDGDGYYFVPHGGGARTVAELFDHPQWPKIADRLPGAGAYMFPCVSADAWLRAGPIRGFEPSILINGSGAEIELPGGARQVLELLAPPEVREGGPVQAPDPPVAAEDAPGSTPGNREGSAPTPPARRPGEGSARVIDGSGGGPGGSDAEETSTASGRRRVAWPIAAAAVLALSVGAWVATRGTQAEPPPVEAASGPEAPAVSESPGSPESPESPTSAAERPLPYSVMIASYSSLQDATALERSGERAGARLYVAPTVVRGVVYYRVLAGLLPERERAVALMRRLVDEGVKDTARSWDVRPARLAFNFGTFGTAAEADAVVERLRVQGIPGYAVAVAGDDGGGTRFRVYAGGYESPEDAGPLREQIERAGLTAELIERVGVVTR